MSNILKNNYGFFILFIGVIIITVGIFTTLYSSYTTGSSGDKGFLFNMIGFFLFISGGFLMMLEEEGSKKGIEPTNIKTSYGNFPTMIHYENYWKKKVKEATLLGDSGRTGK